MYRSAEILNSYNQSSSKPKTPTYEWLVSIASNPNYSSSEIIKLANHKVPKFYEFLINDARLNKKQKIQVTIDFVYSITDAKNVSDSMQANNNFSTALRYLNRALDLTKKDNQLENKIIKARNHLFFHLKIKMLTMIGDLSLKLVCKKNIMSITPEFAYEKFNLKFLDSNGYVEKNNLIPTKKILCELLIELYGYSQQSIFNSSNIETNKSNFHKVRETFPNFSNFEIGDKFLELSPYAYLRVLMLFVIDPKKNHLRELPKIYKCMENEINNYVNWLEAKLSLRKELANRGASALRALNEQRRQDRQAQPPRIPNRIPDGTQEHLPVGWEEFGWWHGGE